MRILRTQRTQPMYPCHTNRRAEVHKRQQLTTPSLRFPLQAGGTEPLRGSPREAGGTSRRGKQALTPSYGFPMQAGGTEPLRGSPREAGGTSRKGAIVFA